MIYHRYYLLTRLISGVEGQFNLEHFQLDLIISLNKIKKAFSELMKAIEDSQAHNTSGYDYKI